MSTTPDKYWTAFYTKPRSERKTALRLEERGYEVYCPSQTVVKQWSDRKKKVVEPVFSSYLFARVDEKTRQEILQDHGIVHNVFWLRKPAVIREEEIQAIQNFLNEFKEVTVTSTSFASGEEVEIDGGPLMGKAGVIQKIQGQKAYLTIQSLDLLLQAEVGVNQLQKKKGLSAED